MKKIEIEIPDVTYELFEKVADKLGLVDTDMFIYVCAKQMLNEILKL